MDVKFKIKDRMESRRCVEITADNTTIDLGYLSISDRHELIAILKDAIYELTDVDKR